MIEACSACERVLARCAITDAPSTPMKTQIKVIKVPFICSQTEPVVVPLEKLLATWPQKSVVKMPPLKEMTIKMMNKTSGMILKTVPIELMNEALSTPWLTKIVNSQQKMIATMIEGRFWPPLKIGKNVPKELISIVAKAIFPSHADSQ